MLISAWKLAKPYWSSDEKAWAWSLSAAVIALNIGMVYIGVRLNLWRKDLFDALQVLDALVATYQTYLKQMLHIRWRRWLTNQYLNKWLDNKAYYDSQLENNLIDNPDQRIAEDLDRFTDGTLTLSLGLLNAVMTLLSFLGILWFMSGYMLLFALIYAVIGTWITHRIGSRLVKLNFDKQQLKN